METPGRKFWWRQGYLKKNNLVYHRTNKCAGTYLFNLLSANGWKEIDEFGIEDNDIHFGFLLDPYVRRAKAITERIYMASLADKIDENFIKFIEDSCICDEHLIPYYIQFKNISPLHLFPILPDYSIVDTLKNFLKTHNIEIQQTDVGTNSSNPEKIAVYNRVNQLLKWRLFEYIFHEDIKLYDKIHKEFINSVNKEN